jgi:hypothetical protein
MYFSTTKQFRDYLYQLLTPYIGNATLAGGAVVPAVFVGEPPIDTRMRGLELSIPKDSTGNSQGLTGGIAPTNKFEFRLIQHPGSDYLSQAKDTIVAYMTPIDYRFLPAANSPSGKEGEQLTLDQYIFSFSRSALVLRLKPLTFPTI